jgi:hypothetical protein
MNTLCRCGLFPTTGFVSAHERARAWFDAFAIESYIELPSVTESHVYSPSESMDHTANLSTMHYRYCRDGARRAPCPESKSTTAGCVQNPFTVSAVVFARAGQATPHQPFPSNNLFGWRGAH